jgi:ADP-heptose:LPS heptosyltransferase
MGGARHAIRLSGGSGEAVRRALVIHPGALGDVLQAIPALRALGTAVRVTFAGQPRIGRLLAGAGLVHAALPFDTLGLEALFTLEPAPPALRERLAGYDRVVSWFGSRDAIYPDRLRALVRDCVVASPVGENGPVWRHLAATPGLPAAPPAALGPLPVPEGWRRAARGQLSDLGVEQGRGLLVIHPGAGSARRRWPPDCFARVIGLTGTAPQVLIHQGPGDREAAERLLPLLDRPIARLVEPDLDLLAGVLSGAAAYLGGDCGVSQLAAAVGAPAVILFPRETRARWAPWNPTALTLGADEAIERIAAALAERLEPRASPP